MELIEILNKTIPNAGPQARASIAEAERRLTMLEGTDPKRAGILRQQAANQISSRDDGIKNTLADIGRLHGSSLGRAESQEKPNDQQDQAARSIEELISIADSRNIAIPPADLASAANAFASKDQDTLSALANRINESLNSRIEVQDKETKEQRQFDDGTIAMVGLQSGSRYDNTGNIIPFGNQNAQIFRSVASEAYSPQSKEIMAAMGGGSDLIGASAIGAPMQKQPDIGANPEAYAATQVPDFTSTQLKEQAIADARDLYDQGNPVEAAQKLNAYGIQGSLGGAVSPNELEDIFGKRQIKETTPSQDIEQSPSVNFFDSLTTDQKKKYLETLSPEARKNLLEQRVNRK
jgi:hypothetical protein